MSIGKSRAKVYVEKDIKTTFADVAGVDEAKDELKEVVSFLKDPESHGRLGAHIPKGVLLVGPPGTGKTLLARAVAGEAGVPFFSISGSEFVEMFVGVGAARVRDLFEQARKHAPAIVFIDELDALGRARGAFFPGGGGHDEKEQTLNQLLSELDGFDPKVGVVLLAATNRPEVLDPALLRAGRFDRQVLVDRPDKKGRVDILQVHLTKIKLAAGTSTEEIAALTPGFTGADLANLVNEAALLATRRGAEAVTLEDFTQAVERIVAGLEKRNRLLNPHERQVVAHHEMGHALVAMALPGVDPVQKISIIPRGIGALGYTIQRPLEDRFLMDRKELLNRMTVLLGGRAAETLVFEEISTGAADDLAKATEIARNMVARFGMDPELGQVAYETEPAPLLGVPAGADFRPRHYGEETADAIDGAVRGLIDAAFQKAVAILSANRSVLDRGARDLLAKETLARRGSSCLRDEPRAFGRRRRPPKDRSGIIEKAEDAGVESGRGSPWKSLALWLFGLLVLAAVILVVLRLGELKRFVELAQQLQWTWIALALVLQGLTYVCATAVWHAALASAGAPHPLRSLVPLGVAKLFTDQTLPSGGISGTVLVVRALARRGVPSPLAMGALLVGLVSFYTAYGLAALGGLIALELHHAVGWPIIAVAALFTLFVVGVPAIVLSLRRLRDGGWLRGLSRLPAVATLLDTVAAARSELLHDRTLMVKATALQLAIFLLDGATLYVMVRALGQAAPPALIFGSFMIADIVATIGPIPLGLGVFEGTAVTMLNAIGISIEGALAATLLLRGFTFWLPMLPGLWLAHRELYIRSIPQSERTPGRP